MATIYTTPASIHVELCEPSLPRPHAKNNTVFVGDEIAVTPALGTSHIFLRYIGRVYCVFRVGCHLDVFKTPLDAGLLRSM